MYIIAGLGNPGLSYSRTRHNIGFMALDALARRWGIRIHTRAFQGLVGEGLFEGEKVLLIKPQTYMNLSGSCLREVMGFYKLPPEKLIVLVDDVELPLGSLRIRSKGSAGTHNGLRSILSCLGSDNFVRIRIGCGQDQSLLLRDFVLKRPGKGSGSRSESGASDFEERHEGGPYPLSCVRLYPPGAGGAYPEKNRTEHRGYPQVYLSLLQRGSQSVQPLYGFQQAPQTDAAGA